MPSNPIQYDEEAKDDILQAITTIDVRILIDWYIFFFSSSMANEYNNKIKKWMF